MLKVLPDRASRGEGNAGGILDSEKLGEIIMNPIHLLDKPQSEKYLHARKIVEGGVSLAEH